MLFISALLIGFFLVLLVMRFQKDRKERAIEKSDLKHKELLEAVLKNNKDRISQS